MNFHIIKKIESLCNALSAYNKKRYTSAVILAAGKSERMDNSISKQMLEIEGIPVVVRAALAFEKCERINEIIIVAARHEIVRYKELKQKYTLTKLKYVTVGGTSRAESAYRGFQKVSKDCSFVAFHDAARCLIMPEDIDKTVREAYQTGAAVAAKRMTDTVKQADPNGWIERTIDRSTLWLAQTPQVFKKSVYEASLASVGRFDETITDDSMLAELSGFRVKLVECHHENIKITTKQDLMLAEEIICRRKRG